MVGAVVGEAVEGALEAVVGTVEAVEGTDEGAVEAVEGTVEGAVEAVEGAIGAVEGTVEGGNEAVEGAVEAANIFNKGYCRCLPRWVKIYSKEDSCLSKSVILWPSSGKHSDSHSIPNQYLFIFYCSLLFILHIPSC